MRIVYCYLILLITTASSLQAQIITTVAGTTCLHYGGDGGLAINAGLTNQYYCYPAFDNAGNMYFCDADYNTIRRVDAATGIITTIAGSANLIGYSGDGGPAINALLYHPTSIAIDASNNIIFADRNGLILREITPAGIISTISGPQTAVCGAGDGGPLINASFADISGLTIDHAGNMYISDYGCNVVRKVNTAGFISTIAGTGVSGYSGDGGQAVYAQLAYPCVVGIDNAGNVYIPDAQNQRIRKITVATGIITTIAGSGTSGYSGDGGPATSAQMSFPGSVVFDNAGNLYFGDYNMVIRRIDPAGIITTIAGTGVGGNTGDGGLAQNASILLTEGRISIDATGNIYFVNYYSCVIRKITNCPTPVSIVHTPVHISLCNAGNVVFSIQATNATGLLWQVNDGTGWTAISDNAQFAGTTTTSLTVHASGAALDAHLFRCAVTNSCGTIFSPADTLSVALPVTPQITITSPSTSICQGTTVTFTASETGGGNTPVYQWLKNGIAAGTNAPSYSDNQLQSTDQIVCKLTSDNTCVNSTNATSNAIAIQVNATLQATVQIAVPTTSICAGDLINFTTTVTNAGTAPVFQWMKNGANVGGNSPLYSDDALSNGDLVSCQVTSDYTCPATASVKSNTIAMLVRPVITPLVVVAGPAIPECPGASASFSATTNVTVSQYTWLKNNLHVASNSANFTDNNATPGSTYACAITATGSCLTAASAVSNTVELSFFATPVVNLDHTQVLCAGDSRILDAGKFVSYLWNDGSSGATLTVTDTGRYFVVVTDVHGCSGADTASITAFATPPSDFLPADTSICSFYGSLTVNAKTGYISYLWSDLSTGNDLIVKSPGLYYLDVTDANNCKGRDSILVSGRECITGFYVPSAFTPNHDGRNDLFRPLLFGNVVRYQFRVYNRWGQLVFESATPLAGWDGLLGGTPQQSGTYVWSCSYQLQNEPMRVEKGTVVLVR